LIFLFCPTRTAPTGRWIVVTCGAVLQIGEAT
jgi:hypothetical protein